MGSALPYSVGVKTLKRLLGWIPVGGAVRASIGLAVMLLALFLSMTPVQAQATRTWVSGVGDDVNPCSRTAPCKTFAGAISTTAAGGIINCLDPGGFGTLTITKSLTIDCRNTQAGMLATGGINGININDTAGTQVGGIRVELRGLSIEGIPNQPGSSTPGNIGIRVIKAGSVTVEDCVIFGFNTGSARGIDVAGNATAGQFMQLTVRNTSIIDNGIDINTGGGISGGGGIVIGQANLSPNPGVVRAMLDNVALTRNNIGLRVSPSSEVTVKSSVMSHNISFNMIVASGGAASVVNADDTVFSESISGTGVHAEGPGVTVRLSRSTITGNNLGLVTVNTAQILSAGNNLNQGNFGGNGAFSGGAPLS
jgi:hypothetical protein